jgi:hypothetical protein
MWLETDDLGFIFELFVIIEVFSELFWWEKFPPPTLQMSERNEAFLTWGQTA